MCGIFGGKGFTTLSYLLAFPGKKAALLET